MATNPYQNYQNNAVMTANPGELTLMLYNGAIKFCNKAIEAIEKKEMQESHTYLVRVQDIITELQATLDVKYAVAKEMDTLYTFIKQLLIEANMEKNISKINDALDLIRDFRDTWQQVIKAKAIG